MKVVILAGGRGSRLLEETAYRPKPMVEIGGEPILWHIMKMYSVHGFNEFIICLGYMGHLIKDYFVQYANRHSDIVVDLRASSVQVLDKALPPWRVTLVDTGQETMTGGRLKRVGHLLDPKEPFCMTYGDGVSDVDLAALVAFHKAHGKKATLTSVRPTARYGALDLKGDQVKAFSEKRPPETEFVNGGFFVLDRSVLDKISGDDMPWESAPLEQLAASGELMAFRHSGFWQSMDTLRDKSILENLWQAGKAPWKTWV
jgi:glucose-1-phosphate cytidylyltransferase